MRSKRRWHGSCCRFAGVAIGSGAICRDSRLRRHMETYVKTKKHLLRFSMKTLFMVVSLIAVFVNHWVGRARDRKEAAEYFLSRAETEYFWSRSKVTITFKSYRRDESFYGWPRRVPVWLSELVGDQHLDDICRIELYESNDEDLRRLAMVDGLRELGVFDVRESCADMAWLRPLNELEHFSYDRWESTKPSDDQWRVCFKRLPRLRELSISRNAITDEGTRHLAALVHLESLDLSGNAISTAGVRHLDTLPNLKYLTLIGTKIDNGAIGYFAKHRSLKRLSINCCPYLTDDEGIKWLEKELPDCVIGRNAAEERKYRARLRANGHLEPAPPAMSP